MQTSMGFLAAECDVRCLDVWPSDKIRATAMMAYPQLESGGEIRIRYPVVMRPDRLSIAYDSQVPHDWARERLKQTEGEIIPALDCERRYLEKNLLDLVEYMTDEQLPVFEKTAARYLKIQEILMPVEDNEAPHTEPPVNAMCAKTK